MNDTPELKNQNFQMSASIEKLAEALSAAQGQMTNATKNSTNPHFKSRYADLAAVIDCSKEALAKNGLSIVQIPSGKPPFVQVTTMLMHKTGQYITGEITLKSRSDSPQDMGSAITYAKRYALSAMLNIAADDDDDGNASSKTAPAQQYTPRPTQKTSDQIAVLKIEPTKTHYDESLDEHRKLLADAFRALFPDAEIPKDNLRKLSAKLTGNTPINELSREVDLFFNECLD